MLNQVLVKCHINEIKKYLGKQIKGKIKGKEVVLYIRLLCDEFDIMDGLELMGKHDNILLIDYRGSDFSPMYMNLTEDIVGNNYVIHITDVTNKLTDSFVKCVEEDTPKGVTPVIRLQSDFCDLELLYKLNKKYPRVRFCGGTLFAIEGCNVGCCGIDCLKKHSISYDLDAYYRNGNCGCALEGHDFKEIKEIMKISDDQKVEEIEQKEVATVEKSGVNFADFISGNFL